MGKTWRQGVRDGGRLCRGVVKGPLDVRFEMYKVRFKTAAVAAAQTLSPPLSPSREVLL